MKRRNPIALVSGWLALVFAPHNAHTAEGNPQAHGGPGGSVAGQVSNASTKTFLEGATVEVAGTNRVVITDRQGRYALNNLPSDQVVLVVNFSGLDEQRIPIVVDAGKQVVRNVDLNSDIYQMDKFTVSGVREGTARAETLQRLAPNVKNVIASDIFGNQASGNIAEYLQHVAGITANYNGPDVFQVNIRGVGPSLNSVTMDGQQVSTSSSARTGRQFEFEQASLGNIETIEVTKAPTPDMDGASIGGSINLVTKSAFDRVEGRVLTYSLGFAAQPGKYGEASKWQQPVHGFGPSVNFTYSDVIGEKKNVGVTLYANVNSQPVGGMLAWHNYQAKAEDGPVYDYSPWWLDVNGATYSRATLGAKVDYKWSAKTVVSLNTFFNYFHGNNDDHWWDLTTTDQLATVDAAGNRTGGGYISPNFADGQTRVFAGPSSISTIYHDNNTKSGRTFLFSPSVRHRFDDMEIVYSLTYSNAATFYNTAGTTPFDGRRKGLLQLSLPNVGWIVDASKSSIYPTIRQTAGPNFLDYNSYTGSALRLNQNERTGRDTVVGAKFDLKKDLHLTLPVFFKTGFTAQRQERDVRQFNKRFNYIGPDGIAGTADDSSGVAQFQDRRGIDPSDDQVEFLTSRGGYSQWPNSYAAASHRVDNPLQWQLDQAAHTQNRLQNNLQLEETISAAYLMGNIRLGHVSALAGVRVEDTRVSGEGGVNYVSPAEAARRAAWVGPVTPAEAERRVIAQYGGRASDSGDYRVVLPGVHLKYEPFHGMLMRASWSTGVGRPPFGSIIPANSIDDSGRTVSVTNPDLKPQRANNYDLSAEYYFKPQGLVSLGLFRKKISDYIFTDNSQIIGSGANNGFDGNYVGYRLTTARNGGAAEIQGFELSYQQQLVFLPGWMRGLGVYANYTRLETEGNYGDVTSESVVVPGFIPKNANFGVSYRGYGFDLRVQAVYRSNYLYSGSSNPAFVQYQASRTIWNWKSRYDFSKGFGVFLDVENLFEAPLDDVYYVYKNRVAFYREFHPKINAGITGRF